MVKVRSVESVLCSRYLCLCNVLRICNIRAIESTDSMIPAYAPVVDMYNMTVVLLTLPRSYADFDRHCFIAR